MTISFQRLATGLLLLALCAAPLAAAGTTEDGAETDGPTEIRYWLVKPSAVEPSMDLPLVQAIAERTNMVFNFETVPGEGHVERYNVTMASRDVPDVMYYFRFDEVAKYAEQGAFAPLQDLIADYAPNIARLHDEFPEAVRDIRFADGNIYTIHSIPASRVKMGFMIRQDWLDDLGLVHPTTIDDWEAVLRAFKTQDPNGNGLADEIPYATRQDGVSSHGGREGFYSMVQAWGIQDEFFVESREVKYGPTDPRMREALTIFSRWYDEGLIDQEYLTTNTNQWSTKFATNVAGATHDWTSRTVSLVTPTQEIAPNAYLAPVPPPVLEDGQQPTTTIQNATFRMDNIVTVAADATNKRAIMAFLDYLFSTEGSLISYAGPPGLNWDYNEDGLARFTEEFLNHPEMTPAQHVQEVGATIFTGDDRHELNRSLDDPDNPAVVMRRMYEPFIRPAFPNLKFTDEEIDVVNSLYTEIKTYKDEMIDKMIMGVEPLSEFDNFVDQLYDMGLDRVLEVYNAAYDRY
jgi:putative aldouronate transport system substrate-binding protein